MRESPEPGELNFRADSPRVRRSSRNDTDAEPSDDEEIFDLELGSYDAQRGRVLQNVKRGGYVAESSLERWFNFESKRHANRRMLQFVHTSRGVVSANFDNTGHVAPGSSLRATRLVHPHRPVWGVIMLALLLSVFCLVKWYLTDVRLSGAGGMGFGGEVQKAGVYGDR